MRSAGICSVTPRERFTALRRAYRAAHRLSPLAGDIATGQAIVFAKMATVDALRAFTGKWDTCHPASRVDILGQPRRTRTGQVVWALPVSATSRWFFRRQGG